MPPEPLHHEDVQETLKRGCGNPNCNHPGGHQMMYLTQRCHPNAGTLVLVRKDCDYAEVLCRECKNLIVRLAIASREIQWRAD